MLQQPGLPGRRQGFQREAPPSVQGALRSTLTPRFGRILAWTIALAGPASVVVSVSLLLLNQSAFRHGPGVPTAGTTQAWNLIWLGLGLLVLGHIVSVPASLVWVAVRVRRRAHLGPALSLILAYDALFALLLLVWFLFL